MSYIKLVGILFLSSFLFVGCAGVDSVFHIPPGSHVKKKPHKHGPPPHAPAHGYRHKHQHGVELEYDTGIGAYIVVKLPGIYFYNGLYSRVSSSGHWVVAAHFDGPWRVAIEGDIPQKLKKGKKPKKGKKNKKW